MNYNLEILIEQLEIIGLFILIVVALIYPFYSNKEFKDIFTRLLVILALMTVLIWLLYRG